MKVLEASSRKVESKEFITSKLDHLVTSLDSLAKYEHDSSAYLVMSDNDESHQRIMSDILSFFPSPKSLLTGNNGSREEHTEIICQAEQDGLQEAIDIISEISSNEFITGNKRNEIDDFFANQEETIWSCEICGYIHRAKSAPKFCPVCRVPKRNFKLSYFQN